MLSDHILIRHIQQGDPAAFQTLVRRYQGTVFALAYHYVRDFHDAEEVAQDVFLKVYTRLDTLRDKRCFASWLRRIVYTEAMMVKRAQRQRVPTESFDADDPAITSYGAQRHQDVQQRVALMDALEGLPDDWRLLVELRYLGGSTSQEIGKLLGRKPGTVRYQLHRAIHLLKEAFHVVEKTLESQQLSEDFADKVWRSLGRLKGRVLGMDGKPLGNIQLDLDQLLPGGGAFSSHFIQVEADGSFALDLPNWGQYRKEETVVGGEVYIALYGQVGEVIRHASAHASFQFGEETEITLDLRENLHPLRVRVVGPDGQPVRDAQVVFHVRYPGGEGHGFVGTYDCKELQSFPTDAEGKTPMLHLSALVYAFEVTAEGFKRIEPRLNEATYVRIPEQLPEDGVVCIQLESGGCITGQVVDSQGNPVHDAKVVLRGYRSEQHSWGIGRYVNLSYTAPDDRFTDQEGRFAFTTLEPTGAYTLHAYHEGDGAGCLLDVAVGTVDAEIQLAPVATLRGTILKDDQPVTSLEQDHEAALQNHIDIRFVESTGPHASFNDRRIHPYRSAKIHIFTDESGQFSVNYLFPAATYELLIPFEGQRYLYRVTLDEAPETHVTIDIGNLELALPEEDRYTEPLLKSPMDAEEQKIIQEFDKTRTEISQGRNFHDLSTPANALLTLIAACYRKDMELYRQVNPGNWRYLHEKGRIQDFLQREIPYRYKTVQIYRIPVPPVTPQEGDISGIYLMDTVFAFGYCEGGWRQLFNTSFYRDWRQPARESLQRTREALEESSAR